MKRNKHMPEEAGEWRRGGRGVTGQVAPEEGTSLHISVFNSDPQPRTSSSLSLLEIKPHIRRGIPDIYVSY